MIEHLYLNPPSKMFFVLLEIQKSGIYTFFPFSIPENKCLLCAKDSPFDEACCKCHKNVHSLDTCSSLMPGSDRIHRNERMCADCVRLLPNPGAAILSFVKINIGFSGLTVVVSFICSVIFSFLCF